MSHWKGYLLLIVDTSVPASHIAMAEAVVGMGGRSPITDQPDEISVLRKSINGTKYLWKFSRNDGETETPTLDYLKAGIIDNTSLTQSEVDAMIISLEVNALSGIDPAYWYSEE